MKTILKISFILFLGIFWSDANGQDFVYKPLNPAFGGEVFNHNWLLSSANSQDNTKDPSASEQPGPGGSTQTTASTLETFTENLNRQLLNQLSRSLVSTQFGDTGLEEGAYSIGSFDINVIDTGDGLSITIFDASTGNETQILVPYL